MIITTPLLKWYDFPADTASLIITGIKDALVGGGYSIGATISATRTGTFTGLPTDGQTATIDGIVYTAKNTPVGGNDFQIGADATATAANFAAKITATHTTVSATSAAGVVTLTALTGGPAGNGLVLSETLANFTWAGTQTEDGGYKLDSGISPDGLQHRLYAYARPNSSANALFRFMSVDETAAAVEGDRLDLVPVASRRYRIRVTNYEFEVYLHNTGVGSSITLFGGVPWLPADMVGVAVSNVTNSGGLIKVTTSTPHKRITGNSVFVSGVVGVTIAPNPGNVTVIDSTNFTINGSTFAGAYVSGGRVGGSFTDTTVTPNVDRVQLSRAIWGGQSTGGTFSHFPRADPRPTMNGTVFVCTNETYTSGNTGAGGPQAPFELTVNKRFFDSHYVDYGTLIQWNAANLAAETDPSIHGGLYQAFFNNSVLTQDTEGNLPSPGSEHFLVYGTGPGGSVCLLIPATMTNL